MTASQKINVTRSSMPPFEEYCNEIRPLWESGWLTNNGIKHQGLEHNLKEYLQAENITLFTNGHLALENVLQAMDLPEGGEIITTPFTFASTTHAIVRMGFTPVFCDIREDNYTIDPSKIEELITEKTCAIVPVHVYGNLCDTDAIQLIADKHGLKLIYDAAHAFGVKTNGTPVSQMGDASMYSFHATKVFHTIEGGAISCKDSQLIEKMTKWRSFGLNENEDCVVPGGNAKLTEFAAAMGICNLRHVDEEIAKRKKVAERYLELLEGIKGLVPWHPDKGVVPNYAYFPLIVNPELCGFTREDVIERLAAKGIGARRYFYPLTSNFACYKSMRTNSTPIASQISDRVVCLPMYADLDSDQVDGICEVILNLKDVDRLL